MKANTERNEEIVALHDLNPEKYTFGTLAKKYGMARSSVQEIYWREKAKLGDKEALAHPLVRRKFPALAGRKGLPDRGIARRKESAL